MQIPRRRPRRRRGDLHPILAGSIVSQCPCPDRRRKRLRRSDKNRDDRNRAGAKKPIEQHHFIAPETAARNRLNHCFRSTNPIESMFDKVKTRGRRVKNCNADNQLARWSASALLLHEKKFNRIKGFKQLPKMIAEVENLANVDKNKMVA